MPSDMQLMTWMDSKFTHLTAVTSANLHETRELRREVSVMARKRTRGSIAPYLSPRVIPWVIALGLTAAGHLSVSDLKAMLGVRQPYHTDGSR